MVPLISEMLYVIYDTDNLAPERKKKPSPRTTLSLHPSTQSFSKHILFEYQRTARCP